MFKEIERLNYYQNFCLFVIKREKIFDNIYKINNY